MSRMKTSLKYAFVIMTCAFYSCAKSEKNDLKETQLCLNTAAPAQAIACTDKIASNNSAQAYKLRCAAVFISEGYNTPSSFIDALDKINAGGGCSGTCSSTVAAISALTFKNANNANAADRARSSASASLAFSYCGQSETPIYMQISSLFNLGTLAANQAYALGTTNPTETDIKNALATLPAADLGNIASSTYNSTCMDIEKASDSTKKYCAQLSSAVTPGGGADAIGTRLKALLAAP